MRSVKNSMRPGRRLTLAVGTALVAGLAFAIIASGTSLPGSNFEIDNDANLRVDGPGPVARLGKRRRDPQGGPAERRD